MGVDQTDAIGQQNLENSTLDAPYELHLSYFRTFAENHGLDSTHRYSKRELNNKGYAMVNRIGDGQTPLIKTIDGADTRGDYLITEEQLEKHKKEAIPEGISKEQLTDIASDMEDFIKEVQIATYIRDMTDPNSRGFAWAMNDLMRFMHSDYEDGIFNYLPQGNFKDEIRKSGFDRWSDESEQLIEEAMKQLREEAKLDDNIRGIPLSRLDRRGEGRGLHNYPCPCTDCKHVFPEQDGIKIYDDGSITGITKQVRMNMATAHLASHGICNNDNLTVDRDHRYMTISGYLPIYEKRGEDKFLDNKFTVEEVGRRLREITFRKAIDNLGLSEEVSDEDITKILDIYQFK